MSCYTEHDIRTDIFTIYRTRFDAWDMIFLWRTEWLWHSR